MKILVLIIVSLTLAAATPIAPCQTKVSAETQTKEGREFVVIENPFVVLTFLPRPQAKCTSFLLADTGEDIARAQGQIGMFMDHWFQDTTRLSVSLPWQYELVGDRTKTVGLRMWATITETEDKNENNDIAFQEKSNIPSELIGLIAEKTIWLNADNDVIRVEHEIKNPMEEFRSLTPSILHTITMGTNRYYDNWYMPSEQGVVVKIQPDEDTGMIIGPEWVTKPVDGWIAVSDRQTHRGLLFVFDYNYLDKLFAGDSTAGWFMENIPLRPNTSFKYHYLVKPIRNFEDIVHGSEHIIADIRPDEKADKINLALDLAAVSRVISDLTAEITVIAWRSKQIIARQSINIPDLGFDKIRREFQFPTENLAEGLVIKTILRGSDFEDHFEYYYAGDKEEFSRRYNFVNAEGLTLEAGALTGAKSNPYFCKPPRKKTVFDKPERSTIAGPVAGDCKVLVVYGLYTHILTLDDALEGWTLGDAAPEFTWANCPPNGVENFPRTYQELFSFHTIVLSDVNYPAIGDFGFEMICDYVEYGGGLLVVGGPYTLGNGEFQNTRFLEVLPVNLSGPFDLKWAGKGEAWMLKPANENFPGKDDISFAQKPCVFWQHFVIPKDGAQVWLQAGEMPALITGTYGKGKVAVLTLSPTGLAAKDQISWWDWDSWSPLVKNVFTWLNQ